MAPEVLEPTPYPRRRDRTLFIVLVLVATSVGVHLMAFQGLSAWARIHAAERPLNQPIEMVMVEVEPPKPPPPPEEPKPEAPKPPPIKVAREEKPPPPKVEEEEAPPPKPVPLVVGISMSSTSTAGGFASPVGNTTYGKIADKAKDPSQVQSYRAPKYVPVYQVDREPEVLAEVQIPYPPEARRAGIEGKVIMSIRIDAQGQVTSVKVLNGPGYGLEDAAATAMRRARFRPAMKGGEPVETELKYTYVFVLD
jgi:protein TonB